MDKRKEDLEALRLVDLVIPEIDWEQKVRDVQFYQVDVFAMGDDWQGKFDHLSEYCKVLYLPRTEYISTTEIRTTLAEPVGLGLQPRQA